MKKILFIVLGCFAFNSSFSQGSDNASDAAYNSGWNNGTNGGSGFGTWALSGSSNSGFFIGSSSINVAGESWGTYANTSTVASAVRSLSQAMAVSDEFKVSMDNGSIQNGGVVGVTFRNSSGNDLFEIYFTGGGSFYQVNDNTGQSNSTVAYTSTGLEIKFYITGTGSTYQVILTDIQTPSNTQTITGTFKNPAGGQAVSIVRFFNFNAGSGGAADQFFNSMTHTQNVLPVELSAFQAQKNHRNNVVLDWSTATETNNSHFDLQRSPDTHTWQTLATLEGAGFSATQRNYEFVDEKPLPLNFYRLRQVDFDETFSFSKVISIRFEGNSPPPSLSPNPAEQELAIDFEQELEPGFSAQFYDQTGRLALETALQPCKKCLLDVSQLSPGLYFLKINGNHREVIWQDRFVKK